MEARQGPARHVVHPEKINLACSQRRARQKLEQPRHELGYCEGHRDEQPPPAHEAQRDPDQLAQRVHVWPGNLVGPAGSHGVGEHASDGLRHVFYIDWLQAGAAGADERQDREQPREVGQRAEQRVARTEHGAWTNDRSARKFPLDRPFAAPACADVGRPRFGISTDAGEEHEAGDAGRGRASRYHLSAAHVHGLECHATPLDIGRNCVHHGVGSGDGGRNRGLVAHVSALDHDQVQAGRLQDAPRRGGMADRDADIQSVPGEAPHEPPT